MQYKNKIVLRSVSIFQSNFCTVKTNKIFFTILIRMSVSYCDGFFKRKFLCETKKKLLTEKIKNKTASLLHMNS